MHSPVRLGHFNSKFLHTESSYEIQSFPPIQLHQFACYASVADSIMLGKEMHGTNGRFVYVQRAWRRQWRHNGCGFEQLNFIPIKK
jgi:hypothetical protein